MQIVILDSVLDSTAVQETTMKNLKYYKLRTNLNFQSLCYTSIPESPTPLAEKVVRMVSFMYGKHT